MKLSDEQLKTLRQLAERATPGKRHCVIQDPEWKTPLQIVVAKEEWRESIIASESYPNNAEHIAAFNPETIKALLDELEAARTFISDSSTLIYHWENKGSQKYNSRAAGRNICAVELSERLARYRGERENTTK